MKGLIMGFTGPEGAGKTLLMTDFLHKYYRRGGKVFAFPGYNLLDRRGKVVSETIRIKDWITIPKDLRNVAIAIDEAQVFFGTYDFNTLMTRLFGCLLGQRRKRSMSIFFTVQMGHRFALPLREFAHIWTTCFDLYFKTKWKENPIEQGTQILCRMCDNKGLQTGYPGTWSRPRIFYGKKVWDLYNTYSVVNVWEGFTKVEVERQKIQIVNGKVISDGFDISASIGMGTGHDGGISYRMLKETIMKLFTQKKRWKAGELWEKLSIQNTKFQEEVRTMLFDWGINERMSRGLKHYCLEG